MIFKAVELFCAAIQKHSSHLMAASIMISGCLWQMWNELWMNRVGKKNPLGPSLVLLILCFSGGAQRQNDIGGNYNLTDASRNTTVNLIRIWQNRKQNNQQQQNLHIYYINKLPVPATLFCEGTKILAQKEEEEGGENAIRRLMFMQTISIKIVLVPADCATTYTVNINGVQRMNPEGFFHLGWKKLL